MAVKRKRGRKTIFTREKVQAIADHIGRGMTEELACKAEDVNPDSFKVIISKNPVFRAIVDVAQAKFMAWALQQIVGGHRKWQCFAWVLERRHWKLFSRNPEILIKNDTVIQANLQALDQTGLGLTTDELNDLQRLAHKTLNVDPADAARQLHLRESAKAIDVETTPV